MADTRREDTAGEPRSAYVRRAQVDQRIGRLYGRWMPARLRRHLRRALPTRRRQQVRLFVSRVTAEAQQAVEARRVAHLRRRWHAAEVVRWRGSLRAATVVADLGPLTAMRRNANLVSQTLTNAGVEHFFVRSASAQRFRVAVPAGRRAALAAALGRALPGTTTYVVRPGPNQPARMATERTIEAAVAHDYLLVGQLLTDPTRCMILGTEYGCEVELWRGVDQTLVAPRDNPTAVSVPTTGTRVMVRESALTSFAPIAAQGAVHYPSRAEFAQPPYSAVEFPVDVVYTWVDGAEPAWQRRRAEFSGEVYHPEAANAARFISHDELRYSIRSVRMNMPWVRHIYVVTDGQVPHWLDEESAGITVVDHRDIFADPSVLPTFNSHAIESQLHRIDGLSEHFLYFNDDVCIGSALVPEHFFLANGISKYFPSSALVPMGEVSDADIPSSVAGKNNRRLLNDEFGALLTHKMKHVPHALRRSVLQEIEERFAKEHRQTAASRFRSPTDLSIPSSLYHYYAFQTGRAVPSRLTYSYFNLAAPDTPARLRQLLARRDRQVICLNDTAVDADEPDAQRNLLTPFLQAYFPVPSPHEHHKENARRT